MCHAATLGGTAYRRFMFATYWWRKLPIYRSLSATDTIRRCRCETDLAGNTHFAARFGSERGFGGTARGGGAVPNATRFAGPASSELHGNRRCKFHGPHGNQRRAPGRVVAIR